MTKIKSIIEQNRQNFNSVNSKLDYLIKGDNPTKNKLIKAKELKIKVLDQNEFNKDVKINFLTRFFFKIKIIFNFK